MDKNRKQPKATYQSTRYSSDHRKTAPAALMSSNRPEIRVIGNDLPTDDEWMEDNIRFLTKGSLNH